MRTREKLALILCGVLITGCGVTPGVSHQALTLFPVLRTGLTQIVNKTDLPIYAPLKLLIAAHGRVSGYSFATKNSYGITLIDGLAHSVPFNAEPVGTYEKGTEMFSYSVVRVPPMTSLSVWTLLASYNLMGPLGLPKLTGATLTLPGDKKVHWDAKLKLIWWEQSGWLFFVQRDTFKATKVAAESLVGTLNEELPGAHGLFVSVSQATMADWEQKGVLTAIDQARTSSLRLLKLVESYRVISRAELGKVSR